ncbi:hypothetical protein DENSPDRAFT_883756 [Dentipellis sp. KUC8613]|nr:hypothetical protein DENSPDRAFT_883756 [Dentipellis sp. KUC8613]
MHFRFIAIVLALIALNVSAVPIAGPDSSDLDGGDGDFDFIGFRDVAEDAEVRAIPIREDA